MAYIDWTLLIAGAGLLILFVVSSLREKENGAALLGLLLIPVHTAVWSVFIFLGHLPWVGPLNLALLILLGAFLVVSLLRFFPAREIVDTSAVEKYDERDMMFARSRLRYHPDLAARYYAEHPDKREIDAKLAEKPNLGEPGHTYYDKFVSPVFDAAFSYLERTRFAAHGPRGPQKTETDGYPIAETIAKVARYYGAVDVGFTALKDYHFYSRAGRRAEDWGRPVVNDHRSAVVIIVAMDTAMVKGAPTLPTVLESSRQYVEAAKIAHIVAEYIRTLGYDARAHTDGNYQVLCVPLAVDAGLGELGRIGIFMHPVYGPCVRISVVTTEAALEPTPPRADVRIDHFCKICKKCADNCPSKAISREGATLSRGFCHWSTDQEKCYGLWRNIGTDCAFCIRVCPYSKPDTLVHRLVRFYISRNALNQRLALLLDDLFYGRKIKVPTRNPKDLFR